MDEFEQLKNELQQINNKQIRIQTIIDQATQKCTEIETKYQVKSPEELKVLLDKAEEEYKNNIEKAAMYVIDTKQALAPFEELL